MRRFTEFKSREKFLFLTVLVLPLLVMMALVSGINSTRDRFSRAKVLKNDNRLVLKYQFDKPTISPSELGNDYYQIIMTGAANEALEGEPNLPSKSVFALIPKNKEIESFEVIKGNRIGLGKYLIEPGQKALPLLPPEDLKLMSIDSSMSLPKDEIYQSNKVFPSEELLNDHNLQRANGYEIAIFDLSPVEYLPLDRELFYYDQLTVKITLKDNWLKSYANYQGLKEDKERVERLVDNPDELASYINFSAENEKLLSSGLRTMTQDYGLLDNYEFVLITRSDLLAGEDEGFRKLVNYKNSHGTTAFIATVDGENGIYANYEGRDEQEKIRNFIRDAYQNLGVRYVMLGGDADGEDLGGESETAIVPVRLLKSYDWVDRGGDFVAGDIYYSCLDGSYDSDKDSIFGEQRDGRDVDRGIGFGTVDMFAEVFVGRVPADSLTEVNNFVNKEIDYLENHDEYLDLKNVLFAGQHIGFSFEREYATQALEQVRNGSDYSGYTTKGFVENPFYLSETFYDSDDYTWTKEEMVDRINDGLHIIVSDSHGWNYSSIKLDNSDVGRLENSSPFFEYSSFACHSTAFDNWLYARGGSPAEYKATDAISEHFLTEKYGAFAFVGNSRFGWCSTLTPGGASQKLVRWFWNGMFGEEIKKLGKLHSYSKEKMTDKYYDSRYRYAIFSSTLLGDPQLELFTSMPLVPPSGLNCDLENNSISWNEVVGADAYALRIDANSPSWSGDCPTDSPDYCGNVTETTFDYEFNEGTNYHVWVHSLDSLGNMSEGIGIDCGGRLTPTPTRAHGIGETRPGFLPCTACDLDNDQDVDMDDINILADCFGEVVPNGSVCDERDVRPDGVINIFDFVFCGAVCYSSP